MKLTRMVLKNLWRNKRRTFLTVSSIAVSLFLVATLDTVLNVLQNPPETPASALRLITRHHVSLFNLLPISYRQKIAAIDGVDAVVGNLWFGGIYKDPSNFFHNMAVNADQLFIAHSDVIITEAEKKAFIQDRTGCVVGNELAKRFNWKLGDKIFLKGTVFSLDLEFTLRGIYKGGSDLGYNFYFHMEYLTEGLKSLFGQWDQVGSYTVKAHSAEDVTRIAEKIDAIFKNTGAPTKTETEKAFVLGFISMLGDVQLFITSIISVVFFTILLVAANTMAMSIRERTREIGVLKALGFRSHQILGLLVSESVLLAFGAALIGSWGAKLFYGSIPMAEITKGFIRQFNVTFGTLLLCAGIGLLVGLIAAGVPAWQASRRSTIDALRRVP